LGRLRTLISLGREASWERGRERRGRGRGFTQAEGGVGWTLAISQSMGISYMKKSVQSRDNTDNTMWLADLT
jgi:hypothetical protein